MKLYHATQSKNAKRILKTGIRPSNCKTMAYVSGHTLQGTNLRGVYGWTSIEDAQWFIKENCWRYDAVIVSFEADDVIDDPEFGSAGWIVGQSKFAKTSKPIKAEFVCEY